MIVSGDPSLPDRSLRARAIVGSERECRLATQTRIARRVQPIQLVVTANNHQAGRFGHRAAWRQRKRDDRKREALWYEVLDLAVRCSLPPSAGGIGRKPDSLSTAYSRPPL